MLYWMYCRAGAKRLGRKVPGSHFIAHIYVAAWFCHGYGDLVEEVIKVARRYGMAAQVSHLCNNPFCCNILCMALELAGAQVLRACRGALLRAGDEVSCTGSGLCAWQVDDWQQMIT